MNPKDIKIGQYVRHTITNSKGFVTAKDIKECGGDTLVHWDRGGPLSDRSVRADSRYLELITPKKEQNMKQGNYIIGSVTDNGEVSFSKKPVQHSSYQLASQEAERLAKQAPGKKFLLVKVIGTVKSSGVTWE